MGIVHRKDEHPHAVRGYSPRQICEALRCALGDAEHDLKHEDISRGERLVRVIDAMLDEMQAMGVAFCDVKDRPI